MTSMKITVTKTYSVGFYGAGMPSSYSAGTGEVGVKKRIVVGNWERVDDDFTF